jgi:hypothetical protein
LPAVAARDILLEGSHPFTINRELCQTDGRVSKIE